MTYLLFGIAVFAAGLICGVAIKHLIDEEAINEYVAENRKLHRENVNLKKHEVIEIIDHTKEPKSYFEPF